MYNCIDDYHKLVICNALPRDIAETILVLIEKDVHQPIREAQKGVLQEMMTHERCIYLRHLHTLLDKYGHNGVQLTYLLSTCTLTSQRHDDQFIAYAVKSLASDIEIYYMMEGEQQWDFYNQLLLCKKYKDIYIEVMELILGKLQGYPLSEQTMH